MKFYSFFAFILSLSALALLSWYSQTLSNLNRI